MRKFFQKIQKQHDPEIQDSFNYAVLTIQNLKEQHHLETQAKTKTLEDQNELLQKVVADCQLRRDRVASLEEQIRGKDEKKSIKVLTYKELLQNLEEEKLRMEENFEKKEHNQNNVIQKLEAECQSLKDTISSLQTQIRCKEEELEGKQNKQVEKLNKQYQQKIQECNAIQQKFQELATTLSKIEKQHAEEMSKKDIKLHELLSAKTNIEELLERKENALHAVECEKFAQSAQIKELQEKITNFEFVLKNDYERSEQVRMLEKRPQLSVAEKNFVVVNHQYQQLSDNHGALLLSGQREKSESDDTSEKELQEKLEAEKKKSIELQQSVNLVKLEIKQLKDRLTLSTTETRPLEVKLKTAQSGRCSFAEYTKMKKELSDAKENLSNVSFECSKLASQYRRSQDDLDKFKYAFRDQKKGIGSYEQEV